MTTSPGAGVRAAAPGRLRWFNELPSARAHEQLLACCGATGWARQVAAGRPYESVAAVLRRSDAAVVALTQAELAEALAGHPRIGDCAVLRPGPDGPGASPAERGSGAGGMSRREQSGVAGSPDAVLRELGAGNAAYEQRFGHIYLACATGRSGAELLEFLRQRLQNSSETEWDVVASELAKINQVRLRELLAGQS